MSENLMQPALEAQHQVSTETLVKYICRNYQAAFLFFASERGGEQIKEWVKKYR